MVFDSKQMSLFRMKIVNPQLTMTSLAKIYYNASGENYSEIHLIIHAEKVLKTIMLLSIK